MDTEKKHWERVYSTKLPEEVSWTQQVPETSLAFIRSFNLPKNARIIDVGGGDSKLVDYLLNEGFTNITVLDISEHALNRAKARLGKRAGDVTWIVADVTTFKPQMQYDVWHDRATFHFLTKPEQRNTYIEIASRAVTGYMVIGTFSSSGPEKCSGLPVQQYTEHEMEVQFSNNFEKLKCITEDHITPFNTKQNFIFCSFKRK